jgi:hypothetical protein
VRVRKTAVCISSGLKRDPSVAAIRVESDWMVAARAVSCGSELPERTATGVPVRPPDSR